MRRRGSVGERRFESDVVNEVSCCNVVVREGWCEVGAMCSDMRVKLDLICLSPSPENERARLLRFGLPAALAGIWSGRLMIAITLIDIIGTICTAHTFKMPLGRYVRSEYLLRPPQS